MAEETDKVIEKAIVWLQERQEILKNDGILVVFKGEEYVFLPKYIDR